MKRTCHRFLRDRVFWGHGQLVFLKRKGLLQMKKPKLERTPRWMERWPVQVVGASPEGKLFEDWEFSCFGWRS